MTRRAPAPLPALVAALLAAAATALTMLVGAAPASAHEERPAQFPDGTGHRPSFLGFDNPRQRVVCQSDSAQLVAAMPDGAVKDRNERLLDSCRYRSIQDAIDSVRQRRTSVYVLPGTYHEAEWARAERSDYCSHLQTSSTSPLPFAEYIGSLSSPDPGTERAAAEPGFTTATDLADWVVRVLKKPFREAHHISGSIVKRAEELGVTLDKLPLAEMQKVDPAITQAVFDVLSLEASVRSRMSLGGTAPDRVKEQIHFWREKLR